MADTAQDARSRVLTRELADRRAVALLVIAGGAEDPDLAPFVGPAHLGRAFVVWPGGGAGDGADPDGPTGPHLGYFTAMERGEAAATGLALLTPEVLGVEDVLRQVPDPARAQAVVFARGLEHLKIPRGRIALAGHAGAGLAVTAADELGRRGWTLIDGHEPVRLLRKVKTETELEAIREAARGTVAAFERVAELLAAAAKRAIQEHGGEDLPPGHPLRLPSHLGGDPLTIGRLRQEISQVFGRHGLAQAHGNIVAPGEQGAVPHSAGDDHRTLRTGESLVVDLYPKGTLWADCTRTFCIGPPPEALAKAHGHVLAALQEALQTARPGVRGWTLQEATCRRFREAGYANPIDQPGTQVGYVHSLGHGVGHELHEYPSFRKEAGPEGLLAAGDVITLEPGLYDEEAGYGVRLEDLVVLGEGGVVENLTPLPYGLDPVGWGVSSK